MTKRVGFIILLIMCVLAMGNLAFAGSTNVVGDEDTSVGGTAVSLTVPQGAAKALITVYGDPVRWKCYTTAPTADAGAVLSEGDLLWLEGRNVLTQFRAILKAGGASAKLYVVYFDK